MTSNRPPGALKPPETMIEDRTDSFDETGPRMPADNWRERFAGGLLASILFNAAIWTIVAQIVHTRIIVPLPPATFKRIILPAPPKPKKTVQKIVPPKPKPLVQPKPLPTIRPPTHQPPPPIQHNHILTSHGPTETTQTALPNGTAPLGNPIEAQSPEPAQQTPPPPAAPQQQPQPQAPLPPPPATKPAAAPGPTLDAQPGNQVYPNIPDELKTDDYSSFVRVKVEIAPDGSFTVTLVSSSGNDEIDERVLDALKRWKWSPALNAGTPVESTERFRFNFEVQ